MSRLTSRQPANARHADSRRWLSRRLRSCVTRGARGRGTGASDDGRTNGQEGGSGKKRGSRHAQLSAKPLPIQAKWSARDSPLSNNDACLTITFPGLLSHIPPLQFQVIPARPDHPIPSCCPFIPRCDPRFVIVCVPFRRWTEGAGGVGCEVRKATGGKRGDERVREGAVREGGMRVIAGSNGEEGRCAIGTRAGGTWCVSRPIVEAGSVGGVVRA